MAGYIRADTISNAVDVKLYDWLKRKSNGKYMWVRNNVCTMICNGMENFAFYFIAFAGEFGATDILQMGLTATIIEIFIALCDTPFLYLSTKIKDRVEKQPA